MSKDIIKANQAIDGEYQQLVSNISSLWSKAKE